MASVRLWLLLAGLGGLAFASSSSIPDATDRRASHFRTQTVSYDTWTIPKAAMFSNQYVLPSPCDDCIITSMSASLNYKNGSRADLDTGVLLHHAVLLNLAKEDRQCAPWKERFFWSGNERTPFDLANDRRPGSRKDYGYYLDSPKGLLLIMELMNMNDAEQEVVFAMNWEWTEERRVMQSMKHVTPYWLDVAKACSTDSEVPNLEDMHFQYTGQGVTIQDAGQVAMGYGHAHQGASNLTVNNGGKVVCEFFIKHADESEGGHIKNITHCADAGRVEAGDVLTLTGNYDTDRHAARKQPDGSLEPTMGLVMLYVLEGDLAPGLTQPLEHEEESSADKQESEGGEETNAPRPSLSASPIGVGLGAVALLGVGFVCGFYLKGRRRNKARRGSKGHRDESMELMKNREDD